jgi:hypothetical protein
MLDPQPDLGFGDSWSDGGRRRVDVPLTPKRAPVDGREGATVTAS